MKDATDPAETVLVPLVGHVRMPLPPSQERAEFAANLDAESDRIKDGQYTLFERDTFLEMLREGYTQYLQQK